MNNNNTDAPIIKNKLVGCDGYVRIGGAHIRGQWANI
jgi:hypothetical protein